MKINTLAASAKNLGNVNQVIFLNSGSAGLKNGHNEYNNATPAKPIKIHAKTFGWLPTKGKSSFTTNAPLRIKNPSTNVIIDTATNK